MPIKRSGTDMIYLIWQRCRGFVDSVWQFSCFMKGSGFLLYWKEILWSMTAPTFSRLVPVISKYANPGANSHGRSVMVRFFKAKTSSVVGSKPPTVIFVPGFMSHGKGLKANHLAGHCVAKGYNYLCYDPEGYYFYDFSIFTRVLYLETWFVWGSPVDHFIL